MEAILRGVQGCVVHFKNLGGIILRISSVTCELHVSYCLAMLTLWLQVINFTLFFPLKSHLYRLWKKTAVPCSPPATAGPAPLRSLWLLLLLLLSMFLNANAALLGFSV